MASKKVPVKDAGVARRATAAACIEQDQIRPSQCQKSPKKNVIDKPLSSSLAVSKKLFTFYTNRYFYRKYLQKEKKWNDFLN